ncbi:MAG: Uma2 family endonuclease [Bacteroidota bacterium]
MNKLDLLDISKKYSYADYLSWRFKERVELIKGKIFKMSPAPLRMHQKIARNLTRQLDQHLEAPCELYFAPFDVRLPQTDHDDETYTVVQPDICIICDQDKLDDRGCNGAPDLIVEILSPATMKKDLQDKFDLYEENRVKEYWIVHVDEKIIEVFYLDKSKYQLSRMFTRQDKLNSVFFKELEIDLTEVFD